MNDGGSVLLKLAAAALIGLLLLDRVVITPGIRRWRDQGERIGALREDVVQGRRLMARESAIRERWAEMQRTDLAEDVAVAQNEVFQAMARWGRAGRVTFTGLNTQWRSDEDRHVTLECRANATGDQAGIVRFIEEMEKDPLAVRLESCELTATDAQGQRLTLAARFSALRIKSGEEGVP